jgi:general nucleoside transport system ATP-binding protein
VEGIVKKYGSVVANDGVDLDVRKGEVHAIFGENGAGKSTLMKILYGLVQPDEGELYIEGEKVRFHSPADALNAGIGMVHQTFKLVPNLTVLDNIALTLHTSMFGGYEKEVGAKIDAVCKKHNLEIDKTAIIRDLGAHEQQLVEILKLLCLEPKILIFDEPTSVLVGDQITKLLEMFRDWADMGYAVIFISHKLDEVLGSTDRISILRNGKRVGCVKTRETNENELIQLLVGGELEKINAERRHHAGKDKVLVIEGLSAVDEIRNAPVLTDLNLSVSKGEIFGIAGVMGNGQDRLVEIITGTQSADIKITGGKVYINNVDVTGFSASRLLNKGIEIGYVPPKPKETGVTGDWSLMQNILLRNWSLFGHRFIKWPAVGVYSNVLIEDYGIVAQSRDVKVSTLSGGNQTKVILAREMKRKSSLMVIYDPCPGLDLKTIELFKQKVLDSRKHSAVLLIASDLNLIMSLCDNIGIIYDGNIRPYSGEYELNRICTMMTGGVAS